MIWLFIAVVVTALDQGSKYLIRNSLDCYDSVPLIPDAFHITHVENDGASWGMFSGGRWIFVTLTVVVVAGIVIGCINKTPQSRLLLAGLSLIVGGAVGNWIDRIVSGHVTDFIDVRMIRFPVFNLADIAITIGTVLVCLYLFFRSSDDKKERAHE